MRFIPSPFGQCPLWDRPLTPVLACHFVLMVLYATGKEPPSTDANNGRQVLIKNQFLLFPALSFFVDFRLSPPSSFLLLYITIVLFPSS